MGLQELEACRKTLVLREQFIDTTKLNPPPESAWWQEPTFVVGSVVVSLSVGMAVGFLISSSR